MNDIKYSQPKRGNERLPYALIYERCCEEENNLTQLAQISLHILFSAVALYTAGLISENYCTPWKHKTFTLYCNFTLIPPSHTSFPSKNQQHIKRADTRSHTTNCMRPDAHFVTLPT